MFLASCRRAVLERENISLGHIRLSSRARHAAIVARNISSFRLLPLLYFGVLKLKLFAYLQNYLHYSPVCSLRKQGKLWLTAAVDLIDTPGVDEASGKPLWDIQYERHRTIPSSKVWQPERKHCSVDVWLWVSDPGAETFVVFSCAKISSIESWRPCLLVERPTCCAST